MKAMFEQIAENAYDKNFGLMYNIKNTVIHPSSREYFDCPVNFNNKGFLFTPKFRRPNELFEMNPRG